MASEALAWMHLAILVGTVLIGGVIVSNNARYIATSQVDSLILQLQQASTSHGGVGMKSVALGFNANLDLVCHSTAALKALGSPAPPEKRDSTAKITTMEEFLSTFAFFYKQGSAAERRVDDIELFTTIVSSLIDHETGDPIEGCEFHTGGNAALMANRFASFGVDTLLAAPVASGLERHLDPRIRLAEKSNALDEIHLILEHQRGDHWTGTTGTISSPRANRFIVSHDVQNSHMQALEAMQNYLSGSEGSPQVLVVAGAHLLEGIFSAERGERLNVLVETLKVAKSSNTAVHFELAGVGDDSVLREIAETVLPHSQSIGLNEQELGALYVALGGISYSIDDFTEPTVHAAIHAIEHILALPIAMDISRVHLHYLTYHLIAQRTGAEYSGPWSRQAAEQAVAAGALMTTTVACGKEDGSLDPSSVRIQPFTLATPGDVNATSLFMRLSSPVSGIEFRIAPVLVCKSPIRTVGLGDSISATGLANHIV